MWFDIFKVPNTASGQNNIQNLYRRKYVKMSNTDVVEAVVQEDEELLTDEEIKDIEKEVNEVETKEGNKSIYVLLEEEIMGLDIPDSEKAKDCRD